MKEEIVQLICSRLQAHAPALSESFRVSGMGLGCRHVVLDDLLPADLARRIHHAFPPVQSMRLMSSFRARKYTSKGFDRFNPLLADITFAMQDPRVVQIVQAITGLAGQIPDSSLYAGGLIAMSRGHFLGPHIDNSHDAARQNYRTLNLLYYVTPDWALANGGNLELWDKRVRRSTTIVSRFNRLAIMETNPSSWHSVSRVRVNRLRCCVSNYYFAPISPTGRDYFHITAFSAWPEQKLRRLLAWADGSLRQGLRKLVPSGIGKSDVYEGPIK